MCSSTRPETMQCLHPVEHSLLHSILRYSLYTKRRVTYCKQSETGQWEGLGMRLTDHAGYRLELLPCKNIWMSIYKIIRQLCSSYTVPLAEKLETLDKDATTGCTSLLL